MSGGSPSAPSFEKDFGAATANLKDTAKWIVGAVATAAAGVLVGTPLMKLGALAMGGRLVLAACAAVAGFTLLGLLYRSAVAVIATEAFSIAGLAAEKGLAACRAKKLQALMCDKLPDNLTTFKELAAKTAELAASAKTDPTKRAQLVRLQSEIDALTPELAFQNKRLRFRNLEFQLATLTPLLIISIGVYCWAATPADHTPLSEKPYILTIRVQNDANGESILGYQKACFDQEGLTLIVPAVVVAEYPGYTDILTLPRAPCPPKRLLFQNNHVIAK